MKNSLAILSLLALAVTASSAFADFRPGRVRAGAFSEMRTVSGTGVYERNAGARVELNYEDGKISPVSITLKMDGAGTMVLPITKVALSSCGDSYVAVSASANASQATRLELTDFSNIQCRMFVANKWHVSVKNGAEDSLKSEWSLEGQPEFLAVTLTARR